MAQTPRCSFSPWRNDPHPLLHLIGMSTPHALQHPAHRMNYAQWVPQSHPLTAIQMVRILSGHSPILPSPGLSRPVPSWEERLGTGVGEPQHVMEQMGKRDSISMKTLHPNPQPTHRRSHELFRAETPCSISVVASILIYRISGASFRVPQSLQDQFSKTQPGSQGSRLVNVRLIR